MLYKKKRMSQNTRIQEYIEKGYAIPSSYSNSSYNFPQNSRIDQYNVGERNIIMKSWSKQNLSWKYN